MIPLEDAYTDVLAKAQRGLGLNDDQLTEKSGVSLGALASLRNPEGNSVDVASLEKLAAVLELNPPALVRLAEKKYLPTVEPIAGLACFNTPYEDFTVNSYLVWDETTREAIVFDTGADATELLHTIVAKSLRVSHILLTHTHGDHIFDLDRVIEKTGAPTFTPDKEPLDGAASFTPGTTFRCGSLQIDTLLTNGHSPGGTTFYITGLAAPVAIVGDSLFAGSMGGAAPVWNLARTNNRDKILTLPPDTILCPGHGPLTTVALELENNPFFPSA